MEITHAQRDVRTTFVGGFAGQLVSAIIWGVSAAAGTWNSPRIAIWILVVGGCFIYPLTVLVLRMMGRPGALPKGHPMNALGMQVAFIVPLCLPVIGAATLHRLIWFYPACMIIVGAHYLPFIFMYGMRHFAVLAALLIGAGFYIGAYMPSGGFTFAGWLTAGILLVFAFILRSAALSETRSA